MKNRAKNTARAKTMRFLDCILKPPQSWLSYSIDAISVKKVASGRRAVRFQEMVFCGEEQDSRPKSHQEIGLLPDEEEHRPEPGLGNGLGHDQIRQGRED